MVFSRENCASLKTGPSGLVAEAWSQGLMVGALVVLFMLTIGGMRRGNILHQLIVAELTMATLHGTYIFVEGPTAGWYVSSTAVFLYISYNLHNVINWIKVKPFLDRWSSLLYIGSLVLVWPYWIAEMYLNFAYNNNLGGTDYFTRTRPWETFCREPWWVFTTVYLLFVIKRSYECGVLDLIYASRKFGVLLVSMAFSIAFIVTDVAVTIAVKSPCAGANPFWKLALVFKCTADTIFLDDFKSVLDRLSLRARNGFGGNERTENDGVEASFQSSSGPNRSNSDTWYQDDKERALSFRPTRSNRRFNNKSRTSQHIERAQSTEHRSPRRSTTKEWFDVIEPA